MEEEKKELTNDEKARISASLHSALSQNDLNQALKLVANVPNNAMLEELNRYFLIQYKYNFKTRFFEKGDFQQCLKFSDVLNRRDLEHLR